jgi:Flp pilus assembly protein TadG
MFARNFNKTFNKFVRHAADLRANAGGNVGIITALACLPMIAAVGCVMDYTEAATIKTKLQAAADAASLAAISNNSPLIATAKSMSGNGSVTGASTFVQNFFNANLSNAPQNVGYSGLSATGNVTKNGMKLTSTVNFSAVVPTTFMSVAGFSNVAISGSSTASYTMPSYIDFYLMLDVSGSMSFPSTTAEQTRLQNVNPDNKTLYPSGCTFACHFTSQGACTQSNQGTPPSVGSTTNPKPGGYCQGFIISRLGTSTATGGTVNWTNSQVTNCSSPGTTSCIQLRADAVGYAVNALLQQAQSTEQTTGISNQFRVGLYPFIVNLYSYVPLTSNLTGSINTSAANLASLLDTGVNSNLGSGGTHFENALPSVNGLITSVGTGTSPTNTLPYVFLVTDGSEDCQTQWNGNWGNGGGGCSPYQNSATTINTSLCSTLKNRGITVAVLYIPYETIQNANPGFANNEDGYANDNIPAIPGALQSCASPNFFYTANSPADITNALVTMFEQAVNTAHITN